jgi:hypothetical protein
VSDSIHVHLDLRSPEGRAALARAKELLSAHLFDDRAEGRKALMGDATTNIVNDILARPLTVDRLISDMAYVVHAQSFLTMVLVHLVVEGRIPAGADDQAVLAVLYEEIDRWLAE